MRRRLGKFEEAQTRSGEYAPFNAVGILGVMKGPSPENLRLVLNDLQKKHPLLQSRILNEGRAYVFAKEDPLPVPFSVLERRDDESWKVVAEEELNSGFDISAGPLFRCRYLYLPDGDPSAEIILTFHHSIVEDLGAESADIVNPITAVEDRYGIVIDEEEIPAIRAVEDLFRSVEGKTSGIRS